MYSTLAGEQYHELLVPKNFGPTTRATLTGEYAPAPGACWPLSPHPHHPLPSPPIPHPVFQVPGMSTALHCLLSPVRNDCRSPLITVKSLCILSSPNHVLFTPSVILSTMLSHSTHVVRISHCSWDNPQPSRGPYPLVSPPLAPPSSPPAPGPQVCIDGSSITFSLLPRGLAHATAATCQALSPPSSPSYACFPGSLVTSWGACVVPR